MGMARWELEEIARRSDSLVAESRKNIEQMEKEHAELLRAREARIDAFLTPDPDSGEDSAEDSRFFKNGNLALSGDELMKVMEKPKQFSELCGEVEDRVQRQRTESKKPQSKPGTKKWFTGDRTPDIKDMLDPKNLREMMLEMDSN